MNNEIRRKFPTSFLDKNGKTIVEGDYISITETHRMSNHYYNGYDGMVNREPNREWDTAGTVIYLIGWDADVLVAERVRVSGEPHPSIRTATHLLNKSFESKRYEIIGNIHDGFVL